MRSINDNYETSRTVGNHGVADTVTAMTQQFKTTAVALVAASCICFILLWGGGMIHTTVATLLFVGYLGAHCGVYLRLCYWRWRLQVALQEQARLSNGDLG